MQYTRTERQYDRMKYCSDEESFHDTDFVGVLHFTMIDQCFIIMLEQESDGINT
jgi:lysyl-tRNA synthetase class II